MPRRESVNDEGTIRRTMAGSEHVAVPVTMATPVVASL